MCSADNCAELRLALGLEGRGGRGVWRGVGRAEEADIALALQVLPRI